MHGIVKHTKILYSNTNFVRSFW